MNGTAILLDFSLFTSKSKIHVMRDGQIQETYSVNSAIGDISELVSKLVSSARENEIYNVRIRGSHIIIYEIQRRINEYEMLTYNENKITVEGL